MTDIKEPIGKADDQTPVAERGRRRYRAMAPELVATSLGDYLRTSVARVKVVKRVLPVIGGLLLISILFQSLNSHFLTAGNLINLLVQGAVYMLLAMGEVYALLLGEIDLSIGFVSGIGGWSPPSWSSNPTAGPGGQPSSRACWPAP